MSNLQLNSLEVRNFRAFRHLRVEKLGRVNLITGRNNVGKSCLLEALWLYARRGDPAVVWSILGGRGESKQSVGQTPTQEERADALKYLFHGRRDISEPLDRIEVGPADSQSQAFFMEVHWRTPQTDETAYNGLAGIGTAPPDAQSVPVMMIGFGKRAVTFYQLTASSLTYLAAPKQMQNIQCVFAPARGLITSQIGELWDAIALTDYEQDVVRALRIIAPAVERLSLVADKSAYSLRNPIVKVAGLEMPIPLRSMGEGMNRLFGIALALVNAKGGLLLIDEVETGIHYTALPDLWRLIFQVAHELNVQVFATTHSWDCIQSFQQAADENTDEDGMLIRLENRNGDVRVVSFDEAELNIVARDHIEVR